MPSKRVSLKGKGADLFFGEERPATPLPPADPNEGTEAEAVPESTSDERAAAEAPDVTGPTDPTLPKRESRRDMSAATVQSDGTPRTRSRKRAGVPARDQADAADAIELELAETIEAIRKTVKDVGREVSFTRLSPTEKGRLADIVYAYKRQGVKTSENEINRIAINLLLSDYERNGDASVLARVLAALQA